MNDKACVKSPSIEKELQDLRKETNVLIKDIEVCKTNQGKLINENNQLENEILQRTEILKNKYRDRKTIEQLKQKINHLEEAMRNFEINYGSQVKELSEKNSDLEESLELMRHEFEEMENYWQKKMEDERNFYDTQIKLEAKQFKDLELKIQEYDERFSNDKGKGLFTIQEDEVLENEVTFLEGELEDLRDHMNELIKENDNLRTQIFINNQNFIASQKLLDNREPKSLPCPYIYL